MRTGLCYRHTLRAARGLSLDVLLSAGRIEQSNSNDTHDIKLVVKVKVKTLTASEVSQFSIISLDCSKLKNVLFCFFG